MKNSIEDFPSLRSRRLEVHSRRKKERAHDRETCEGRGSAYPEGSRFQPFHGHVSYKFDKFWTLSDGRKLRRISTIELIPWFKVFKVLLHLHRLFNLSSNEDNHSTVVVSKDRIELEELKIIRQRKESMHPVASHFGFFAVIALNRNFIFLKKVGRIVEFKTFKIFRLKYNSCILNYNL